MSLTNHDFQWGRSEVVIIYPDVYLYIYIYISINMARNQPFRISEIYIEYKK